MTGHSPASTFATAAWLTDSRRIVFWPVAPVVFVLLRALHLLQSSSPPGAWVPSGQRLVLTCHHTKIVHLACQAINLLLQNSNLCGQILLAFDKLLDVYGVGLR